MRASQKPEANLGVEYDCGTVVLDRVLVTGTCDLYDRRPTKCLTSNPATGLIVITWIRNRGHPNVVQLQVMKT